MQRSRRLSQPRLLTFKQERRYPLSDLRIRPVILPLAAFRFGLRTKVFRRSLRLREPARDQVALVALLEGYQCDLVFGTINAMNGNEMTVTTPQSQQQTTVTISSTTTVVSIGHC